VSDPIWEDPLHRAQHRLDRRPVCDAAIGRHLRARMPGSGALVRRVAARGTSSA
jgi:hypothetical protein